MTRVEVRRTAKLFIGGAFPRSESGRTYPLDGHDGRTLANVAKASRKDARDAVVAARAAVAAWSGTSASNRGQVLYRVAELLEGRRDQFIADLQATRGEDTTDAAEVVDAAIDRWVWYAGWADKYAQVGGTANPVTGPYFNFSLPEPVGVVAVIAPPSDPLLGLVSVLAPVIVSGNTCVAVVSHDHPLPAVSLAEVLATADVPGGVVNLLTGDRDELTGPLAAHMDVNAIDLTGVDPAQATEFEVAAADNLKRVRRPGTDPNAARGPQQILAFTETKTVWHPRGQ